ncbi:MAG TPA: arginase [Bryobacteraceae bacterium]|nr:arginase [Bryobacteraceae bacterium]
MTTASGKQRIAVIGAPLDLGQGRRGVDMGPSAVRVAGLGRRIGELGYDVRDLGNVDVTQAESTGDRGPSNARYLTQIAESCQNLARIVEDALDGGNLPIVLGGDHSIAAGTMAGVASHFRRQHRKAGLLWIDAHADMNTPATSPSGNVHGMPLACCVGRGPAELVNLLGFAPKVDPANVALVGIRDVDLLERTQLRETGVTAFTMREIDERGMRDVLRDAIRIACDGTAGFHLSLDLDFVDPAYAPGVGTPVRGGATYREAHLAMEMICDSGRMVSMEVVEVNPVIDEFNRTAELAVELILSALGKKIL